MPEGGLNRADEMQVVAIVGVGLIGGSFALGLRGNGFQGSILGVSSAPTLARARERGVIDEGLSLEQAAARADLIYLSQPVSQILEVLPKVAGLARAKALVTDAGSTKAAIVARASEVFHGGAHFLGGHPLAGKAERGVEAAEAGLFAGTSYVLTPESSSLPEGGPVSGFRRWLKKLGARELVMDPEAHDRIVAFTSHLPQMASTALASLLGEMFPGDGSCRVAGAGLRDATRLAASPFQVWRDICRTNAGHIDRALAGYIRKLEFVRENLTSEVLEEDFQRGSAFVSQLQKLFRDSS